MSTTPGVEIVKSTQDNVIALRQRVEAIEVKTPQQYVAVCNLVIEGRGFIKRWQSVFAETIRSAKEHLSTVQNELKTKIIEAEEVVAIAERKGEAWKAEDRRQRQADQDKLQKEADEKKRVEAEAGRVKAEAEAAERKTARIEEIRGMLRRKEISKRAAEVLLRQAGASEEADKAAAAAAEDEAKAAPSPTVHVASSVPKVASIKGRVNQKFEVVDAKLIPHEWCKPDEVRIGEKIRSMKNPKLAMALIPGIRVWEEDSI